MKRKLFKSLLAVALICTGSNAWAQSTETVNVLSEDYESYATGDITETMQSKGWNFQSKNNKNQITIVQGNSESNNTKYFDFYYPDGGANRNQSWNMNISSQLNVDNWTLSFIAALNPGTNNSPNKFYVVGTGSGKVKTPYDDITNSIFQLFGTAAAAETYVPSIANTSYSQITLTKGVWYRYTITASAIDNVNSTENIYVKIATIDNTTTVFEQTVENFNFASVGSLYGLCWNSPRGYSRLSLDNILVTKEVPAGTCDNPTYTLTGVNGTARKFTLSCATDGATIYYSATELAADAEGWNEYSGEVTSEASTIYIYAKKGTAVSEVVSFSTGAGEKVSLNAAALHVTIAESGDYFVATANATSDQSSVAFAPTAVISAEFTPEGGTASSVALPFTPTENGHLTVTTSADGYESAVVDIPLYAYYIQRWKSVDFSSLTGLEEVQAALGDNWSLQDNHGRWASWSEGSYNFYQIGAGDANNYTFNGNLRMRGVTVLAEGLGLGRNVNGGEAVEVLNTDAGEVVKFEVYKGFGAPINKGVNTEMVYAISNGVNRPVFQTNNGNLIVQVTVYSAKPDYIDATITSAGWATLFTPCALDFTSTGLTAYTATCNGSTVTLEEVDDVPANTGVVLEGAARDYSIPTIASSSTAKGDLTGSATEAIAYNAVDGKTLYVLAPNGKGDVQFQPVTSGTIAAGKAYLRLTTSTSGGNVKALSVAFGTATSINAVESVRQDGMMFNLAGQRVSMPARGLYIKNGKKVVVK